MKDHAPAADRASLCAAGREDDDAFVFMPEVCVATEATKSA
jgi:hypothetical protein